jgi:hypothetical protein
MTQHTDTDTALNDSKLSPLQILYSLHHDVCDVMAIMGSCMSNSCEVLECNLIEDIAILVISVQFDAI